jgi:N-acylneuraminate cytidylyltransferase
LINRIIVSTDSEKYANLAKEHGADVPYLRPAELAGDTSTDYEFVKHLLDWLKSNENCQPDYLVHLRPVVPLRDSRIIDSAIEAFINNTEATSLRSAHEMSETAYKKFEIEGNYFKAVGSDSFELDALNEPRQKYFKTYDPNGYVDVLKTSFVLSENKIHGNRVMPLITPMSYEIDAEEDFEYLEWQINRNDEIIKKLFRV